MLSLSDGRQYAGAENVLSACQATLNQLLLALNEPNAAPPLSRSILGRGMVDRNSDPWNSSASPYPNPDLAAMVVCDGV